MVKVIDLIEIKNVIGSIDVVSAMEYGFKLYSQGETIIPPVGELIFDNPKGEAHIKYGYIKSDSYYVIKVASGFYENHKYGIDSCQGLMLLFSKNTGVPLAILLDEGYLTNIRTAAAGALVAKYFSPKNIKGIGKQGTGIQAKLQLEYLQCSSPCKHIWVWGRNEENAQKFASHFNDSFSINIAASPSEVAKNCNLIVTTTPSKTPLLKTEDILPGTHITAVGSDTEEKQELDSSLLKKADLVIADSLSQSESRGEIFQALKNKQIRKSNITELGNALLNKKLQRPDDEQITVTGLTGVAIQDVMIAKAVYERLRVDIKK